MGKGKKKRGKKTGSDEAAATSPAEVSTESTSKDAQKSEMVEQPSLSEQMEHLQLEEPQQAAAHQQPRGKVKHNLEKEEETRRKSVSTVSASKSRESLSKEAQKPETVEQPNLSEQMMHLQLEKPQQAGAKMPEHQQRHEKGKRQGKQYQQKEEDTQRQKSIQEEQKQYLQGPSLKQQQSLKKVLPDRSIAEQTHQESQPQKLEKVQEQVRKKQEKEALPEKRAEIVAIEPQLTNRRTGGTQGRAISLKTNHFPLKLGKILEATHYDVAIDPDRPKKLFRIIMEEFRRKYYGNRFPAFDGSKNLYSAKPLQFPNGDSMEFCGDVTVPEDDRQREFKVSVKYATKVDLTIINNYINQKGHIPVPMQALQCLDIVLRSAPALSCIPCGRSYFTMPRAGQTYKLGDGSELYYGFYQSAILGWKPFLNVDVAHKAFPMAMSIIDLIKDMFERIDLNSEMDYRDIDKLNKHLRTLKVQYEIPGNYASRRVHRVNELNQTAAKATFNLDDPKLPNKKTTMTVQKYYQTEKHVNLKYPNLPCLWVGSKARENKILIPCEFCTVLPGQAVNRKMTELQTRNLIKKAATNTETRMSNILASVRQANYNRSAQVREFDLSVSEEPQDVRGRILTPPNLQYKNKEEKVFKGTWRASEFESGAELNTWTILNCDRRTMDDKVRELERQIVQCGQVLGMNIAPAKPPFARLQSAGKRLLEELKNYFNGKKDYQLIVVVISDQNFVYHYVKQASELAAGCLTQCIKGNTVFRLNRSTVDNILLKINAKRNGLNHSLKITPKCLLRPCIIMGADVTHPSPDAKDIPSIAAVTASYERKAFKYNFCWRLQDPKEEIIGDLEAITKQHLIYFYRKNNGARPERLIFFRDGVSDGQFGQVLRVELTAIRKACSSLQQDYKPKITFLVVQKRHHTRFFPTNSRDSEDRNCNVPAGTCVDTIITHPAAQDFYLVSHASIQGVAKPTKYRTLWDDADMSDDELEQLTYYLCHLFARCTRSVSYPAPTYYAHLAAARAKVYCETEQINMGKLQKEQDRLKVQDCIIKDLPMYFV